MKNNARVTAPAPKKPSNNNKSSYLTERYQERSIANRLFK